MDPAQAQQKYQAWSGSELFNMLWGFFMKDTYFEEVDFEKSVANKSSMLNDLVGKLTFYILTN